MKEFELIKRYFDEPGVPRKDVEVGIGDDAAIINVPEQSQLIVTTDTLVEGIHFFADMNPRALGHKAVAVNLSDIAAMGGEPTWLSLSVTLPHADEQWVKEFSCGLFEICEYFNVQVVGGDTTQGPLTVTVSAKGLVPKGKALLRSGAQPGDWIYVTGTLGDAGVAIDSIRNNEPLPLKHQAFITNRFEYPTPRVAVAQGVREVATAAIDISDGLISDLQHVLTASNVGAVLDVDQVPLSEALRDCVPEDKYLDYALCAGDDYELLFTVPEDKRGALDVTMSHYGVNLTCVGQIQGATGKLELRKDGELFEFEGSGYQHFSKEP